jgi:hypothetical protein
MEQPIPMTANHDNFMWHSTTHLVIGQFPGAPSIDWIAVLLPYRYPDLVDRGVRSAPFPSPQSNWTALTLLSPSFDWDGMREPMIF